MTTYAVISDLHANFAALTAVLADADTRADRLVCLGDIVGYNAAPAATLDLVRQRCHTVIAGNHDQAACGVLPTDDFNPAARAAIAWTRGCLDDDAHAYLKSLLINAPFGDACLASHGTPDSVTTYILGPEQALDVQQSVRRSHPHVRFVFFGHTHYPLVCRLKDNELPVPLDAPGKGIRHAEQTHVLDDGPLYLINPGSVGQPRDGDPRAAYVLFDEDSRTLEFRRVAYDIAATQALNRCASLPQQLSTRLAAGR